MNIKISIKPTSPSHCALTNGQLRAKLLGLTSFLLAQSDCRLIGSRNYKSWGIGSRDYKSWGIGSRDYKLWGIGLNQYIAIIIPNFIHYFVIEIQPFLSID